MTRLLPAFAIAVLAALAIFAVLAARLRPRVGPVAGILQAALLALFLSLSGAFLALRILDKPAGAPRSLIVLADADASRRNPQGVRGQLSRLPRGVRTRLALFDQPGAESDLRRVAAAPGDLLPEAAFSSLEAALGWAALEAQGASLPEVLLLGDRGGSAVGHEGLALTRVPLPLPDRRDRIAPLRLAPRVFPGRPVTVRALVRPPPGPWALRLLLDDRPLETRFGDAGVEGTAEAVFTVAAGQPGVRRLLLELRDEGDTVIDREYAETTVEPFPVLGYAGPAGVRGQLPSFLAAAGFPLESISLESITGAAPLPRAEILVIEDLGAAKLPWPAVSALSRAAAWEGRGLLFVGGPRSFTAGGYQGAPVERLLPLTMGIRDPKEEKHRTALVVVLDTSASMLCPPEGCAGDAERMWGAPREARGPRVRKIDVARQALLELLPVMQKVDHFGILGVRTAPYWELEPGALADPAAVEERVRRIGARDGGINLFSALLEASKGITALDAEIRHVLVLLDTADVDETRVLGLGTVQDLVAELGRQRVSVSFVGFGFSDDRYVPLLHQLASSTGGSLYLSSDVASIPRFLREDREGLSGRRAIRRHLETRHDEGELPGVTRTPPVEGIFVTEAREDARTLVWTEIGYPLAAVRRIERGAVAAFASDGGQEMAPAWTTAAARETWDGVLATLLPRGNSAAALFPSRQGRGASIWWEGGGVAAAPGPATVSDAEGRTAPAVFREVYPGSWRAEIAALPPGSCQVSATQADGGIRAVSFTVPPAPASPAGEAGPDLAKFAPPPDRAPVDGRIPPLLLLLAAAGFAAYELFRERD